MGKLSFLFLLCLSLVSWAEAPTKINDSKPAYKLGELKQLAIVRIPGPGGASAAAGFTFDKTITFNHYAAGSTLTNYPAAVAGTFDGTNGLPNLKTVGNSGNVQSGSGYDIVFSSVAGCASGLLSWEQVSWSASTGAAEYWVKIPSLSSSADTVIHLCYGNTATASFQGGSAGAAWDSNFKGVWHLPNGSTLTANDSTTNANNGTLVNTPTATAAQVDGGAALVAASSQYIDLGSGSSLNAPVDLTIELWLRPTSEVPVQDGGVAILSKDDGSGRSWDLDWTNPTGGDGYRFYINSAGGANIITGYDTIYPVANVWQHVVAVYDHTATTLKMYASGNPAGSSTGADSTINSTTAHPFLGARGLSGFENYYGGIIDEARISNSARSLDWILADFYNQGAPLRFGVVQGYTATTCCMVTATATGSQNTSATSVTLTSFNVVSGQVFYIYGKNFAGIDLASCTDAASGNVLSFSSVDVQNGASLWSAKATGNATADVVICNYNASFPPSTGTFSLIGLSGAISSSYLDAGSLVVNNSCTWGNYQFCTSSSYTTSAGFRILGQRTGGTQLQQGVINGRTGRNYAEVTDGSANSGTAFSVQYTDAATGVTDSASASSGDGGQMISFTIK